MIYQCGAVQYFPFLTFTIMLKANDQLRRWFEDDDALEQAMGGEYGLTCLQNFDFILCQICSV